MEPVYQVKSEYSEKQMQYYRRTNPYYIGFKILKWICYLVGGFSVFINMIVFITARLTEISIFNVLFFLIGIFLLVDGAMDSHWIDIAYAKKIKKAQKDGEILLSFYEEEIIIQFMQYNKEEHFSYAELTKAEKDFEGYFLQIGKELLHVKRKQFLIGDGFQFPQFLQQKTGIQMK